MSKFYEFPFPSKLSGKEKFAIEQLGTIRSVDFDMVIDKLHLLTDISTETIDSLRNVDINQPVPGEILKYDGSKWINSLDISGLTVNRSQRVCMIPMDFNVYTGSMDFPKSFQVVKVESNVPSRIRLYTEKKYQDRDKERTIGMMPNGNHGLIFEVITDNDVNSIDMMPVPTGYSDINRKAYITVERLSEYRDFIDVKITTLDLEI